MIDDYSPLGFKPKMLKTLDQQESIHYFIKNEKPAATA